MVFHHLFAGFGKFATDGASVYFIDSTDLAKVPVGGGAVVPLFPTGGDANAVAVDASKVYWTTSTDVLDLEPK